MGKVRRHTQEIERLKTSDAVDDVAVPVEVSADAAEKPAPASTTTAGVAETGRYPAKDDPPSRPRKAPEVGGDGDHGVCDDDDSFRRNSLRASLVSAASAKVAAAAAAAAKSAASPLPATSSPPCSQNKRSGSRTTPSLSIPASAGVTGSTSSSSGGTRESRALSQSAPTGRSGFYLGNGDSVGLPENSAESCGSGSKGDAGASRSTDRRPRGGSTGSAPITSALSGDHRSPIGDAPGIADAVEGAAGNEKAVATREFTGVRRLVGEFERKRHTVGSFAVGTEDAGMNKVGEPCPW